MDSMQLRKASFENNQDKIKSCLDEGCDPLQKDQLGYNALHLALLSKNPEQSLEYMQKYYKEHKFESNENNLFGLKEVFHSLDTDNETKQKYLKQLQMLFDENFMQNIKCPYFNSQ